MTATTQILESARDLAARAAIRMERLLVRSAARDTARIDAIIARAIEATRG